MEEKEVEEKEVEQQQANEENQEIEFKQNFQFIPVNGEVQRTYIYENKQVPVKNVYAISIKPDGGHRLLVRDDITKGIAMSPGWITIMYQGEAEKLFLFNE